MEREVYSSSLPVAHSVTQGSILGPILFVIIVNDIEKLGNMVLLADDTTLYIRGSSPASALEDSDMVLERV